MTSTIMNSSRFWKLGLLALLATLCCMAANVRASQLPSASSCSDQVTQQFLAEAHSFGLAVDPSHVKATCDGNGTVVTTQLVANWSDADAARGIDVGFTYIEAQEATPVPNGYYKLRLQGVGGEQRLTFINKAGQVVDSSPVSDQTGGGVTAARTIYIDVFGDWVFIHEYPSRGWPDLVIIIIH